MKPKSRRQQGSILLGLFAAFLLVWFAEPWEPRIEGMRDSEAVFQEMFFPGRGPANGATLLDVIGPERYVRALLKLYHHYRPSRIPILKERVFNWWMLSHFGKWPRLDAWFMKLDPSPAPTVENVQQGVVHNLRYVGPAGAPAVETLTQRLEIRTRDGETVEALGAIGPAASPALPVLRRAASQSNDPWFLAKLAKALQQIQPGAEEFVVPGTIQALSNTNERSRARAADLLGTLGPFAAPAIPGLQALRDDPWAMVRTSAVQALKLIEPATRAGNAPRD